MKTFEVGDAVEWSSQSGSYSKKKTGVVEQVIPSGCRPTDVRRCGFARDHESYVVKVRNKLYWPRVSALSMAAVTAATN